MTVACQTVNVGAAKITATSLKVSLSPQTSPGQCKAPCKLSFVITWKNVGTTSGSFRPNVSVNGKAWNPLPAVTLSPGASVSRSWSVSNVGAGKYTICPIPN